MLPINKIRHLYLNKKLNTREIADILNTSQWTVLSAMRRYKIPRRSLSETNKLLFSKKKLSFRPKTKLTSNEKYLQLAALMLYWAEGSKKSKFAIDFANCDENMVLIFLKTLRGIYQVDEKRLRVFIYCYSNQNSNLLINYWSKLLKIPKLQFSRPYVRYDFDENKKNIMPHGLVHIRYHDKKLLIQIMSEIDIIQRRLNRLR